jgi:hypothetical protein
MDTTDASKSSTTALTKNVIAYNSNVDVHGSNSTSTNRNTIVTKNETAKTTTTLFPKKKEKNKVKLSKEELKSTTDRKGDTSKTATNGIARRKSTSKSAHKALHRLTPSGKLLSCYVVQGEVSQNTKSERERASRIWKNHFSMYFYSSFLLFQTCFHLSSFDRSRIFFLFLKYIPKPSAIFFLTCIHIFLWTIFLNNIFYIHTIILF